MPQKTSKITSDKNAAQGNESKVRKHVDLKGQGLSQAARAQAQPAQKTLRTTIATINIGKNKIATRGSENEGA